MSYEYTVVQPFTLPVGASGRFRSFAVGQKITDQGDIDAVLAKSAGKVSRYWVDPAQGDGDGPSESQPASAKSADADSAPAATDTASRPMAAPAPAPKIVAPAPPKAADAASVFAVK